MSIYYQDDLVQLWHGDCLDILATLPDNSVHAVCTDPPYGLANTSPEQVADTIVRWVNGDRDHLPGGSGFMGKAWDAFVPPVAVWDECVRVLKPGGHVLAFAGSRTHDLMTLALRLAGFEIRDSIAWLYGSGFPKSLDVSKAIDKARDDRDDVLRVTSTLADLAAAAGITRADIDAHMGTSDMGGWWLSRLRHRCACPSVENWTRLRDLIPGAHELDAEVWRLNGRKGSPGEAWESREVIQERTMTQGGGTSLQLRMGEAREVRADITAPATPDAERWQGWGTALKPAFEPIVVARKPLVGTVAGNVLEHGAGALNIDACRVAHDEPVKTTVRTAPRYNGDAYNNGKVGPADMSTIRTAPAAGRWPTNVLLDDTQAAELDRQSGVLTSGKMQPTHTTASRSVYGQNADGGYTTMETYGDSGGASRFFPTFRYEAKAPTEERPRVDGIAHPTVKPLDLMRWLVRLVTPPGGTVLDPFAGSGTTAEACVIEGFPCIVIERETDYLPLIKARLTKPLEPVLDLGALS